ncbi:MAG: hypothetical protein MK226_16605 [Saprospiraceae bacterium]|jgi:hypothetical protein|nr:hypothetical protein [Saprospiraceae bacterium]
MKPLFIALFLCLLPLFLIAQEITVSEEVPINNTGSYEIIGTIEGVTLLYTAQNYTYKIKGLDQELQLSFEKELELDRRKADILAVEKVDKHIVVIYTYQRRSKTYVKAHKYDKAANLVDSMLIKNYGYVLPIPKFGAVSSENRTKLLLFYVEQRETLRALAFDMASFDTLWEESVPLVEKGKMLKEWPELHVADNSDMFFLYRRNNFRSKKKQHYIEINHYIAEQKQLKSYLINMKGKLSVDIDFRIDNKNNTLIGSGLYGDFSKVRAKGFLYMNVPLDYQDNHRLVFHEFTPELLSNLLDKKVKKNKGYAEIAIAETVLRRDGGVLTVLEYDSRSFAVQSDRNAIPNDERVFGRLYAISIHPDGKVHWDVLLQKKQKGGLDRSYLGSFFLYRSPSALRILYNDDLKFYSQVNEYVVNGIGDFKRNSILNTRDLDIQLSFREALQVSSRTFLVPSISPNRLKLVRFAY